MSGDWDDEYESGWDDWPDDDAPEFELDPVPVLTAVFEDGPPSRPALFLADYALNDWPPTHSWVAHNERGVVIHYIYQHVGDGHYRVAMTQTLEP